MLLTYFRIGGFSSARVFKTLLNFRVFFWMAKPCKIIHGGQIIYVHVYNRWKLRTLSEKKMHKITENYLT